MKKIISTILVCVLLIGTMFTLASCSNILVGEYLYEAEVLGVDLGEQTYEFGFLGNVTLTVDPPIGEDKVYEGKYKLNDAGDEITFTFENEEAEEYSGTFKFAKGEENGVKYVKIGLVRYELQD